MAVDTLIQLDRERQLKFRVSDLRELNRRMSAVTGSPVGVNELLHLLASINLEAVVNTLHIGLRHEEPRMRAERAEELYQIALDEDRQQEVIQALTDALYASGVLGKQTKGNAPSPESQPGHQSES